MNQRYRTVLCMIIFVCLFYGTGYADTGPPCPQGAHEFESRILVLNQDDQEGQVENICVHCGYTYIEYLPATGHLYGAWQSGKTAADGETGYEHRTCSQCGRTETRPVSVSEQRAGQRASSRRWEPNELDYLLTASIGGLWIFAGAALWYNSLVLNWYKGQLRK